MKEECRRTIFSYLKGYSYTQSFVASNWVVRNLLRIKFALQEDQLYAKSLSRLKLEWMNLPFAFKFWNKISAKQNTYIQDWRQSQKFAQFWQKRYGCQKRIEEIANIARMTNSTRIASCSKNLVANFCCSYSKNMFNRNCSQKFKSLQKSQK